MKNWVKNIQTAGHYGARTVIQKSIFKKPPLTSIIRHSPKFRYKDICQTLTLSYRKLIEIKGWFKRWIYENGDKESVLTLRMPTMPETLDFLFLVMLCSMICAIISGMFKTGIWKDKGHGKSYKIESGK